MVDADLETKVKLAVYATVTETGRLPSSAEVADRLGAPASAVEAAFSSLHAKRLFVPEPGDPTRLRMANPFSGVITPFPVDALGKRYYGNCVWDALGIPAALHADAVIPATDGFTGEPITLEVRNGRPVPQECVIHFAVPAAQWWQDIIHT